MHPAIGLEPPAIAGFARFIEPPFFAVIFTSRKRGEAPGYEEAAARMAQLASTRAGYLGAESARGADGVGITVSYWSSLEAIGAWRDDLDHAFARERGRREWYEAYCVRIARVERAYAGPPAARASAR